MSHRQTERREHAPLRIEQTLAHTAEEMQTAIKEIAQLEQQIQLLRDVNGKLLHNLLSVMPK